MSDLLRQRFGRSVQVLIGAQIIAIGMALVLGTWAGWRAGGRLDRIVSAGAFTALAVPPFAMGAVLILLFGVRLRWLPPLGYESVIGSPLQGLRHLLLPCLTLGLPIGAIYTRTLRSDVAAAAGQDHVVLARANGLSTRRILTRHVLRQCSLGMLTQIGLNLPWLFSFLVVVERLFDLFGAGELVQEAVANREFLVLQTTILVFAAIYVVVTLALDALHHVADPRLRRVPVDS